MGLRTNKICLGKIIEGEVNASPFYLFTIRDLQIANISYNVQNIKQIYYFLFIILNKDFVYINNLYIPTTINDISIIGQNIR